jgi:DNA-binding MarR family transcriptional regulator
LKLDAFVPYRLSVLANTISGDLARRYAARFDLTIPQWRVMASLGDTPGRSAAEVAERTRMDKVSVSRAVSALLERGLLLGRRDRSDRRRTALRLSANGRRTYQKIVPLARAYEAELLAGLSARERAMLDGLVSRLHRVALQMAAADDDR